MIDPNIIRIGYDTTFELNKFSQPRIRSEIELVKNTVLYILFSKPGQRPSLPHIGLDIQSRLYSFYDEINNNDLKDLIVTQCNALSVYFDTGIINIRKLVYRGKPSLMIHIEGSESYPSNYMNDESIGDRKYLIGITFNELDEMICNISNGGGI